MATTQAAAQAEEKEAKASGSRTKKSSKPKASEKKEASSKKNKPLPTATKFPYAVIRTGSKQYCVAEGEMILVEKLELEPGEVFKAEDVLFVASAPGTFKIGQPKVEGAQVEFEVLQQTLGKKILIRHHRRRQNSQKTMGHRQPQTRLLVKSIKL